MIAIQITFLGKSYFFFLGLAEIWNRPVTLYINFQMLETVVYSVHLYVLTLTSLKIDYRPRRLNSCPTTTTIVFLVRLLTSRWPLGLNFLYQNTLTMRSDFPFHIPFSSSNYLPYYPLILLMRLANENRCFLAKLSSLNFTLRNYND